MAGRGRYRTKALECVRAAESAHDPIERVQLLEIAQYWMKLAEHVADRVELAKAQREALSARHRFAGEG